MIYVIGGGIAGLFAAWELAKAGEKVTVLEAEKAGAASWAGGGILSPLYPWRYSPAVNALARWSQERYPLIAAELRDRTGIDPEWTQSGLLMLDAPDRAQALGWAQRNGVTIEEVSKPDDIEPGVDPGLSAGLWMSAVAQIRNPRLLAALRMELLQNKVVIRGISEVLYFSIANGRLRGISTRAEEIPAERCLVAAGAWTGALMRQAGLDLPIRPVKGQMILFRSSPGAVKRIVLREGTYVVPRQDGLVLAGSTLEEAGFDVETTGSALEKLRAGAVSLIPALAGCPIERHWAGLRPGSPEGVPYIGEHPGARGLFVSSGHYRNGIVMAPASARLVTDLIMGETPPLDPSPYRLGCS